MSSLEGKVALVTGASRGIGRAIALALAEAGADLIVTATTREGVEPIAREISARKRRVLATGGDVGRAADCAKLCDEATKAFGHVDVLVNNAGIVRRAPLEQTDDDDFDRVLAVNLNGPFYLSRRLAPSMAARGGGRIVNVSSISATMGSPNMASYCASKWGLNGLTKSLAEELKPRHVFVAAVLPGSVDTEMLRGSGFAPDMTPSEVARVVTYLAAEAPFQLTGSLVEMFG